MKTDEGFRDPNIELRDIISNQIIEQIQGETISDLMAKTGSYMSTAANRSHMEGYSFKVTETLLPDFYNACEDVKKRLGFSEDVDFYICSEAEINAYAVWSPYKDEPHLICIHSSLFQLMDEDEIRYVLGHEMGHLINHDAYLTDIISFVFRDAEGIPLSLSHRIRVYDHLCELVADRYGYLACDNLESCITAIFKMASGIDLKKMNVKVNDLIKDTNRRLEFFKNDTVRQSGSHPLNPFRVQSLYLYAAEKSEQKYKKGMLELLDAIYSIGVSPIDYELCRYIVAAGIYGAEIDGKMSALEKKYITDLLNTAHISPTQFFNDMKKQNIEEEFYSSASAILSTEPRYRRSMMKFLLEVMLSDNDLNEKEVDLLLEVGMKFGYDVDTITKIIAQGIQENFHYVFSLIEED